MSSAGQGLDWSCILILFDLVYVLIAVPTTVFFPVCPPLVAIRFSAGVKLISSNLFPRHNGGSPEGIVRAGGQRLVEEIARQAKQARPADSTEMAISQVAAETMNFKVGNRRLHHGDTTRSLEKDPPK
jgi:hypothetical protein